MAYFGEYSGQYLSFLWTVVKIIKHICLKYAYLFTPMLTVNILLMTGEIKHDKYPFKERLELTKKGD